MSMCGRCCASELISRYKEDVIEVIEPREEFGWIYYKFYVPVTKPEEGIEFIEYNGRLYTWALTIFSEEHSRDEDCFEAFYDRGELRGFAKTRVRLEQNEEDTISGVFPMTDWPSTST